MYTAEHLRKDTLIVL